MLEDIGIVLSSREELYDPRDLAGDMSKDRERVMGLPGFL